MAVSCVLYVHTAQYIFPSVVLLSSYTVYHAATYYPFLQTNAAWHRETGTFLSAIHEKVLIQQTVVSAFGNRKGNISFFR